MPALSEGKSYGVKCQPQRLFWFHGGCGLPSVTYGLESHWCQMKALTALPLELLGLEQTRSPHGALLRLNGRMVAMLLQFDSGLVVSLPSGNSECFDCESEEGRVAALALIKYLRDEVAAKAEPVASK